ncbi:unnamed protein product [Schistocephalus solidus]|uniref:Bcl-2-like protein 1 n=1 Tax=Schistocephalus solidus TaxID=70667 RepID=A0A0X3P497_SCHSO|nr:unnamed protein product [Schistocephalus solidus]
MPISRHFLEGPLEEDSNVVNLTCVLDKLPSEYVIESIIVDYVLYLIAKRGFDGLQLFMDKRGRTEQYTMLRYIMRTLVDRAAEFERNYLPRFENRQALLLSMPERAKLDFMSTLEDIWSDGLANWGRFLAYITFVGAYCTSVLDAGMVYTIKLLVEAAVHDLNLRVGKWLLDNGGWRGCYLALEAMNRKE